MKMPRLVMKARPLWWKLALLSGLTVLADYALIAMAVTFHTMYRAAPQAAKGMAPFDQILFWSLTALSLAISGSAVALGWIIIHRHRKARQAQSQERF